MIRFECNLIGSAWDGLRVLIEGVDTADLPENMIIDEEIYDRGDPDWTEMAMEIHTHFDSKLFTREVRVVQVPYNWVGSAELDPPEICDDECDCEDEEEEL